MMVRKLIISFTLFSIIACDDKPIPQDDLIVNPPKDEAAFICDEGNYQSGNATLTVFDIKERTVTYNAFESANGRNLGDVCQSATLVNDEVFVIVNNSDKIEVINRKDWKSSTTIQGFKSPRYMVLQNNQVAFVSEFYNDAVKVINPTTKSITSSITCPGWHDEMVLFNSKLYVTTYNRNKIYVINTDTYVLEDSIEISTGSNSMCLDAEFKLWVLCSGDISKGTTAKLFRIDPNTKAILNTIDLQKENATRLRINKAGTTLYWIAQHVYSMPTTSASAPELPFITALGNTYYGLATNPFNDEIWVTDAIDFVQRSTLIRYNASGVEVGRFKTGINSGNITFYKAQ